MEGNTHPQEKNYQLINGAVITPELLKTVSYLQEERNDALETWKAKSMMLVDAFMTNSDGNLDDTERMEHVWTICSLVGFIDSLKLPKELMHEQIKEGGEK